MPRVADAAIRSCKTESTQRLIVQLGNNSDASGMYNIILDSWLEEEEIMGQIILKLELAIQIPFKRYSKSKVSIYRGILHILRADHDAKSVLYI